MSLINNEDDETATTTLINHDILCPGVTKDYRVAMDDRGGYKLVANRRIKKGQLIMKDSLEFSFSDVRDGDYMWLSSANHHHHHHRASKKLAKDEEDKVPTRIPVTREMLLHTHGVPYLMKKSSKEVVIRQYLETPGMFMNHSCDPTIITSKEDEDYAARDIEKGEELTVDYAVSDYEDTQIGECYCGAPNCRGRVLGFEDLSDDEQKLILPRLSAPTKAIYLEDIGKGPPVIEADELVPRAPPMPAPSAADGTTKKVMRLAFPGPGSADAKIMVKKVENGASNEYGLYAMKNVLKGRRVYAFWRQRWPQGEKTVIDMVFSAPVQKGEVDEGTVVRLDSCKCGAYRNSRGRLLFSGWELLTSHSCDPNVVYRNREDDEDENWQDAFAAKDIKKGDRITMDWNCFTWDRGTSDDDMAVCHCGASNCVGTKQGFKYLSPEAQKERNVMTWLRKAPSSEEDLVGAGALGDALSPFVRARWHNVGLPHDELAWTDTQSSTSCSEPSSSSDED